MNDPRTILNLDPTRFLSDGDAYVPEQPHDDDNCCHDDEPETPLDQYYDARQEWDKWDARLRSCAKADRSMSTADWHLFYRAMDAYEVALETYLDHTFPPTSNRDERAPA